MKNEPIFEEFTRTLRRFFVASSLSQADLARGAWLSESYVARLLSGERQCPSRDIVIRLGIALKLGVPEVDELLLAAEHRSLAAEYALPALRPAFETVTRTN